MTIELSILETDGTKRFLRVEKEIIRLGRNPECDICFEKASDESVSWDHAIIVAENDLRLIDQDSSNGTFVNDQRVERLTLTVGDKINLGIHGPKITFLAFHPERPRILDSQAQSLWSSVRNRKIQLGFAVFTLGILLSSGIAIAIRDEPKKAISQSSNIHLEDSPSERTRDAASRHEPLSQSSPNQSHTLSVKEESRAIEPAAPPRTPLTPEQVKELFSSTVVWVGMRISDPGATEGPDNEQRTKVIPWCTGWINEEGKVVVAADRALDVAKAKNQEGVSAQVCQPALQHRLTEVASASTHPQYDPESPVSDRSQLHDAGTLSVPNLVPAKYSIAEPDGLLGKDVLVCGYFGISDTEIQQFSRLTAPTLEVRPANIASTRPCSNCDQLVPLMKLNWEKSVSADEAPRCDGMLVTDEYGGVLGHVVTMSDGDFVVAIENIQNHNLENQSVDTE
jgi:hypothetical protein